MLLWPGKPTRICQINGRSMNFEGPAEIGGPPKDGENTSDLGFRNSQNRRTNLERIGRNRLLNGASRQPQAPQNQRSWPLSARSATASENRPSFQASGSNPAKRLRAETGRFCRQHWTPVADSERSLPRLSWRVRQFLSLPH